MKSFGQIRAAIESGHDLDAKLLMAAEVAQVARAANVKLVVTGGTSVDFYAARTVDTAPRGWVPSLDIDILTLEPDTVGAAREVRLALFMAGFEPSSGKSDEDSICGDRGWTYPGLEIPVEIIGKPFEGSLNKLVEVRVNDMPVLFRGPEDTMYEHLEWAAHARDQRSWTRALAIARAQQKTMDLAYLRKLAKDRGFEHALDQCLRGDPLR